jgi:hypothetical protein
MLIILALLLACIFVLVGVLLAWIPGKPLSIVDANGKPVPGSISEKIWVSINGVQQGMFIVSKDASNPVLLFVHGGPGMPEYWLTEQAHEYMLAQFQEKGNTKAVRLLQANPITLTGPLPTAYDAVRDDYMHRLGIGTTRAMKSVITGVFLPSWFSRVYTLGEKINLWRGKVFSKRLLWESAQTTDLTTKVTELHLPVYFLEGKYDYTCNYALAKSYGALFLWWAALVSGQWSTDWRDLDELL